jgi:probable FeS assembly SUF system protein SufT
MFLLSARADRAYITSLGTMLENTSVELKRDCAAVQIPLGAVATLPAGTTVHITQTLGGNYTVQTDGGLFRIASRDADALGIEPPPPTSLMEEVFKKPSGPAGPVDEKLVWDTLKSCFDPEIPVNIVDLGLIYDMHIEPLPGGNSKVLVKMTLTAPGCGMGTVIASDAQQKLLYLPGVEDAAVEIVWDPPWHQSMITADGRRVLGLE